MKFPSKYNPEGTFKPECYLAEIMLERQYKDRKLPQKFWNDPQYKRPYLIQLLQAKKLLKIYSIDVILATLKNKQCQSCYSLSAKWLDPVLRQEQAKAETAKRIAEMTQQKVIEKEDVQEFVSESPKTSLTNKQSIAGKLRDL